MYTIGAASDPTMLLNVPCWPRLRSGYIACQPRVAGDAMPEDDTLTPHCEYSRLVAAIQIQAIEHFYAPVAL